jgi:chlorobactene glucosyltransferase
MQKYGLHLLSIFPVQIMRSFGEWLTVPLMNRILVGNLPLSLVRKSRLVDFAAANGQFMLFNAEIYKKHWFHEEFRNEKVEDIRIIRMMKKQRNSVSVLLSAGQISCRMYQGYRDGVDGFSKNIHAFFGKNWLILLLFIILTTLGPFSVWLAFSFKTMLVYLAALSIFSVLISGQSRQSVWKNLILMPFQQCSVVIISIIAAYRQFTGRFSWKGRKI